MALTGSPRSKVFVAKTAVSQYRFVVRSGDANGTPTVQHAALNAASILGISMEAAAAGADVTVALPGSEFEIEASAAILAGARLSSTATGTAVTGTAAANFVGAVALDDVASSGQIVPCLIASGGTVV